MGRKEAGFGDLPAVRQRLSVDQGCEKERSRGCVQHRLLEAGQKPERSRRQPRLLAKLARRGPFRRLSPSDATAQEAPRSCPIAVANEEQPALAILRDDGHASKMGAEEGEQPKPQPMGDPVARSRQARRQIAYDQTKQVIVPRAALVSLPTGSERSPAEARSTRRRFSSPRARIIRQSVSTRAGMVSVTRS